MASLKIEVELALYEQGYKDGFEQGVTEFAKWLIDKHITDFTDIVDLAAEFRKELD